jgi:hypothetical protein
MSDLTGVNADPSNPGAVLRAAADLMRAKDFAAAGRLIGWALDFNPTHGGLLRRMSMIRA